MVKSRARASASSLSLAAPNRGLTVAGARGIVPSRVSLAMGGTLVDWDREPQVVLATLFNNFREAHLTLACELIEAN